MSENNVVSFDSNSINRRVLISHHGIANGERFVRHLQIVPNARTLGAVKLKAGIRRVEPIAGRALIRNTS